MCKMKKLLLTILMFCSCVLPSFDFVDAASITVFKQTDSRWASYPYGYSDTAQTQPTNLEGGGCGILSYVNAIYYMNGQFIEPTYLADYSLNNGYRVHGVGTAHALYQAFANSHGSQYGFTYAGSTSSYATLRNHLLNGGSAVGSAPGHLMAIVDYDSSTGKYLILDSFRSSNRFTYPDWYTWQTESVLEGNYKTNFSVFYMFSATGSNTTQTCNCSESYAGTYRVTTSSLPLTIRSGHGSGYSQLGTMPKDSTCTVTKADGSWAHVTYNGISGYASMEYLTKVATNSSGSTNQLTAPHIHWAEGTHYIPTSIWWSQSEHAVEYDLKIWKGKLWDGDPYTIVWGIKDLEYQINLPNGYYEFYIDARDEYGNIMMSSNVGVCTIQSGNSVDLGDNFYASLLIYKNWLHVGSDYLDAKLIDNNISRLDDKIHYFEKQGDGSYIITNCRTRKVLTVANNEDYNFVNVMYSENKKSVNQKWEVFGRWSGEYYIKPISSDRVLDANGGLCNIGDNIQLYDLNYTDAQKYAIYKTNDTYLILDDNQLTIEHGKAKNIGFNTIPFDQKVDWKSSNSSIATVSNGLIKGVKAGTTIITASISRNGVVTSAELQVTITENNHNWDSGVITTQATCTKSGVKTYTCSICKKTKTETIASLGHNEVVDKAVSATCTSSGKTQGSHCSRCNTIIKSQTTVSALGHQWNSGSITKETTCTSNGTKTYTCSRCNQTKTETIASLGHNEVVDKAVDATCTSSGKTQGSHCSRCNAVIKTQSAVSALGHQWNSGSITKAATCTSNGTKTYTCSRCNQTKTEIIALLGHNEVVDKEVSATCTSSGKTQGSHCSRCNTVIKSQTTVSALEHQWNNGTVTKAATCTSEGIKTYICSRCNDSYTAVINKSGHSYNNYYTTDVEATCTAAGSKSRHCSQCNAKTDVTTVYSTGCQYDAGVVEREATCTSSGLIRYTCENCEKSKTETIVRKTHSYESTIIEEATCLNTGLKEQYCTECGYSRVDVIPRLSHTYETVTTKATLSKNGRTEKECTSCGYVTSTKTISRPKTFTLSTTSYTYDGKSKKPSVKVKDSAGNVLEKDVDYTLKYESGRKVTGKYAVTVTFKGKYSGKKTLYFNILPSKTSKITTSCSTSAIKASWNKVTGASGYKIALLNSSGKTVKTITTTKTTYTFKQLSKGKKYKVKVTAYKTIDSKKVYSTTSRTVSTSTKS